MILEFVRGNAAMALASAVLWGGGDFSGGMAVKLAGGRLASALRVVLIGHTVSLCLLIAFAVLRGDRFPQGAALYWGLGAGVAAAVSLSTFYVALSRGAMGAAAAVSGLLTAAIPAAVSIGIEGSPGGLRVGGFLVAALAIWLIAGAPATEESGQVSGATVALAVFSGVGFGVYFVALKFAGEAGLLWPMATVRMGSVTTCLVLMAVSAAGTRGESAVRIPRAAALWALGPALLDTSGNLLFMAATRAGRLDVAAVLAALYPASTILLAAWMLRERPTRQQMWGMAVAVAAVVMITL